MKKKLFVNIILFLELVMLIVYVIGSKFVTNLNSIIPFNYIISITEIGLDKIVWLSELVKIKYLVNLLLGFNMPGVEVLLTLILANVAWILVFYIIFGTIGALINHHKKKKIRKVISEYKLTPTEEKRFLPQNYKKKASKWVSKSLIIPILLIALFVLVRFDKAIIDNWGLEINNTFGINVYTNYILPVLDLIIEPFHFNELIDNLFVNGMKIGYFDLVNNYLKTIPWLEYVVLGLGAILVLLVWWIIFKLISLIFRRPRSKKLAKKAEKKYIAKMEKQEYKLRKKYKDDAIAKGDEFLKIIEEELEEDALEIAKIKEGKSTRQQKKIDARKKAYLEEIGYGVVDLGVSEEQPVKTNEPIVEREIRYISDADVDIILDEEPVIEIVEEDDMEEVELSNKEDDLFFEKYSDDDVDLELVEEHKPEPKDVMDYVEEKAKPVSEEKEEVVEEKEKIEVEKYEEETEDLFEEPIIEEKEEVKKEEEEVSSVEAETPKKVDPFAAYRNRVNKGHGTKKVQSFKDAGFKADEMMVREDGVKVSIKYDPFASWRAQEHKKGYGAKKVPSFKELQAQKENQKVEEKPEIKNAPVKKENPFAKYQNSPRVGTGSKKVPPIKKEEPKKEEVKKASPSKNDPFAAYRNKINKK